jgi:hypothetical protein
MNVTPSIVTRRSVLRLALGAIAVSPVACWLLAHPARAANLPPLVVWKDAGCGCCNGWVEHMRGAGFHVTAQDSANMAAVKQARGVPEALQSCHTAVIDGYVIEGHVPAADVMRLIAERPQAKGLAVPGMPASAPGMDQPGEPYTVALFGAPAGNRIYAQH